MEVINTYKPTETQMRAHRSKARYKLFGGAMGGGKTRWLCEEAKDLSLRYPGNRGVMCRWHLSDFKNSTLKTLIECLPPGIYTHNLAEHTITFFNGSEIIYMGMDEESNVSKIKSMELGWFVIDEASEVPMETFLLFQSRLRRRLTDNKFPPFHGLLASNPADCWLKDMFVLAQGGKDYCFIPSLPKDNPFLPENYESKLRESYPEDWVRRFLEGSWDELTTGDMVLPGEWIRRAINREIEIENKPVIGADIARFGDDEIVIDFLMGNRIIEQDVSNKQSLMETVGRIINKRKLHKAKIAVVDDASLGGGVTDRLKEMDEPVMPINGGWSAIQDDKFVNLKSEMWFYARELFEKGLVSIINDPILIRQLGSIKYHYRSNGKTVVETKDDIKSRLGRSPDRADALILALWGVKLTRDPAKDFSRAKWDYLNQREMNPYGWNYHEGFEKEVILNGRRS